MAQNREQEVKEALQRLENLGIGVTNLQNQTRELVTTPALLAAQDETNNSDAVQNAMAAVEQFSLALGEFSEHSIVQNVASDVSTIDQFIDYQRKVIQQQQRTIQTLQNKVVDPTAIARECSQQVLALLSADNAPFGNSGVMHQINSRLQQLTAPNVPIIPPAAGPSSPGTPLGSLRSRTDEDETRLQQILGSQSAANWKRTPLEIILDLNIRVGDGSTNINSYPPLPSSLTISTIQRLAHELSVKFSPMTEMKWDEDVKPNVAKSTCLYTKVFNRTAADNLYTACQDCQKNNRICVRKAKGPTQNIVFICPLANPVINPNEDDSIRELRYWVPRPEESHAT